LFGQTATLAIAHTTVIDGNGGAEFRDRTHHYRGNRITAGNWFAPTLIPMKAAIHLGDHPPDPRDHCYPGLARP
jgi:hypothetical protein